MEANRAPTIGQLLKKRRKELGFTQAKLAQLAGCASITIRKLEANSLRPSVQLAKLIAQALQVPEAEQPAFVRLARSTFSAELPSASRPPPTDIGPADLSGQSVKGFQLREKVGSGGFGVVYRALQTSVKRDVAIKIILPRFANHPGFIRRFETEASLIARLEHPHIVPLYDFWREPDAAYLVMRLFRGGSLADLLETGPMQQELVYRYSQQIGKALGLAHRNGILHQDIKPANVLLDEEENAYLADFGIAKHEDWANVQPLIAAEETPVTSPAYISPEQILGQPMERRSDIYCLGILLFEMLTGVKPFRGPTPEAVVRQHLSESLPPVRAYAPDLPAELDEIFQQATAKNPADRFEEVGLLLEALERILAPPTTGKAAPVPVSREQVELENPYKGLRAFSEADAGAFFGRENLVDELLAELSTQDDLARFLAIVGPSGSGKSSVARAGLVPALRRGGLPGSENWFLVHVTPGSHPWEEVETALLRIAVNPPPALLDQLRDGERGLLRAVNRILPEDRVVELVLVIDQFEEIFTLVEDEEEREQFLNSLVTAALDLRSRVRVLITLRADFYDRPLQYMDFGDLLRQRTVPISPMTPDELEQAIVRPAARVGVQLEPGLTDVIIRDVLNRPGTLPLLQYTLTELFTRREEDLMVLAAYREAGGVAAALARRADEIYEGLSDRGKAFTRQFFLRLVTLGEGVDDTRRRVLRSELEAIQVEAAAPAGSADELNDAIDEYSRFRLLTFDRDPRTREPTVEIAHEALLLEWARLRSWIRASRDDIRRQRLLAQAAAQWELAGREASYLLRGARLADFDAWGQSSTVELTRPERALLEASIREREREEAAETARQQRELETARQLVETESRRADEQTQAAQRLRRRALFLAGTLVVAAVLAVTAAVAARQAGRNAGEARGNLALAITREAEALANLNLAVTQEARAQENAALASTQEAIAMRREAEAEGQRAIAEAEADMRAAAQERAENEAQRSLSRELAANALLNLEDDPELSILLALEALRVSDTSEGEAALHQAVQASRVRLSLSDPDGLGVAEVVYSPDGRHLFAGGNGGGALRNAATGEWVFTHRHEPAESFVNKAAFSPDGSLLALALENPLATEAVSGTVVLLDAASGAPLVSFPAHAGGHAQYVTFDPAGSQLATIGSGGSVKVWDVEATLATGRGAEIATLCCQEGYGWSVNYSPDGSRLVAANGDATRVWETDGWAELYSLSILANDATFSPDGQYLALGGDDGLLYIVEASDGELLSSVPAFGQNFITVVFSPDGSRLATSSLETTAKVWDFDNGEVAPVPLVLAGHERLVAGLSFSPDGRRLASGSADGTARIWDVSVDGTGEFGAYAHDTRVIDAEFSPDGTWVASTSLDGAVIIWDVALREKRHTLDGHESSAMEVAIHPDGQRLATSGDDGTVRLWDALTGEQLLLIQAHEPGDTPFSGAKGLAFSPDGERLATGGIRDQVARVWDVATGDELLSLTGQGAEIYAVAFTRDGRWLVTAGNQGLIKVWDAEDGREVWSSDGEATTIWWLNFTPDRTRLMSSQAFGKLRFWQFPDVQEGTDPQPENLRQIERGPEFYYNWLGLADLSPNGDILAVSGVGGTTLHDAQTGQLVLDLAHPATTADFSPDGRMLVTSGFDGIVRLFAATQAELVALARSRLTRSLTADECRTYLHVADCPNSQTSARPSAP